MSVQSKIIQLPPFPNSWYTVAISEKLKIGTVERRKFCGQDVVVYGTEKGKAVMSEAYCPHMGADLSKGGQIEGENIRCPFHGFCFDTNGDCVSNEYGTKVPPQAKLRTWPIREQNGIVMAWHHAEGLDPDWEIPALETEGWTDFRFQEYTLNSHPQEIAENSVDLGHFRAVHGYDDVKVFKDAYVDGPVLRGKYGMSRIANFIGKSGKKVNVEFEFAEYGLGYAFVEAYVVEYGLLSQHFVLPCPVDGTEIKLRIAVRIRKDIKASKIHPILGLFPKSPLRWFIFGGYFRGYCKDVSDDFDIWSSKAYVHPPALAKGDGPIILYRKWTKQFYPEKVAAEIYQ